MGREVCGEGLEAHTARDVRETLTETLLAERERATFLAGASRTLSGLLNVDRTVARALGLAVPRLGAWAAIALRSGSRVHLVTSTGTRATVRARELTQRGDGRSGLARPLVAGRPLQCQPLGPGDLAALLPDAEVLAEAECWAPGAAAAVALRGRGQPIGALVLLRAEGDGFDDADLELADDLAQRAAMAIESARLYAERSHAADVLESSLRPRALPDVPGLRLGAFYRPASDREIGGDFYDLHGGDGDWSVVMGDVSGNGVEAAVLTGRARDALRTAGLVDRSPSRMLALANTVLVDAPSRRFVTIVCARLRPEGPVGSGAVRLDLASAGHPSPLVRRRDGTIEVPDPRGTAAGIFPDRDYPEVTVRLGPGDACFFYTDGITEARRADGELFGEDRLAELLASTTAGEPQAAVDLVAQRVLEHLGAGLHDDLAVLAVEVEG